MKMLPLVFLFVCFCVCGADFYVDASVSTSGNGSQAAPFKTIKAAVDAANGASAPSTIHVASGTYAITSASDFVTVSVADLTITAENLSDKPVLALDANLSATVNNPVLFTVPTGSDYFTVSGLAFTYSYAASKNAAGNTFGEKGCAFLVAANYATFENCTFTQTGTTGSNWQHGGLIRADSDQSNVSKKGTHMTVRDCVFTGFGRSGKDVRPIKVANYGSIYRNVFDSCSGYVYAIKPSAGGYFVSNRVVNCSMPFYSNGDSYGEWRDAEFAYNIFVNSSVDCFYKNNAGFSGEPKFHHNTVIDCANFIKVANVDNANTAWTPWIFDNLIITADGGSVICENATSLERRASSFNSASFFTGNAYCASTFNAGTALNFNGYALGLSVSGNKELASAPDFLETADVTSTNYYRLNSYRYPWVTTTAQGATGYDATYVGAIEPIYIEATTPGELFAIDAFGVEVDSSAPPATASFTCEFSLNGGTVTAAWDFDGDGTVDETETLAADATSATKTHSYQRAGSFTPTVYLTDSATGNTLSVSGTVSLYLQDVYVDANAGPGGYGTQASPFKTISEGIAVCKAGGTVHICGGDDRTYSIDTADDLVVIPYRMNVTNYNGYAKFEIASTLHSVTNNPYVITVLSDAIHTTISGLDFTYYGSGGGTTTDNASLGSMGRVIDVVANYVTVSDCTFRQSGNYTSGNKTIYSLDGDSTFGHAAVGSHSAQNNGIANGKYLTIKNCRFLGESDDRSMFGVKGNDGTSVVQNVFSNCYHIVRSTKGDNGSYQIVSNVLYCSQSIFANCGNWGEWPNAEIAYNIFYGDESAPVPFINKDSAHGFNGSSVLIHHNTIVNASQLVSILNNSSVSWQPQIFDNLILLVDSEDYAVFQNKQGAFKSGNYSSFLTGGLGCFMNNAYFATGGLTNGPATQVSGYDLSRGCEIADNIVLTAPPKFVSTRLDSPDFCRPRESRNPTWAKQGFAWTDDGKYPDYIGAVEPLTSSSFIIHLR